MSQNDDLSDDHAEQVEEYFVRICMKLILRWGFTIKELSEIFELRERTIRKKIQHELEKIQFQ